MTISGEVDPTVPVRRHWKFNFSDLSLLPKVGELDYKKVGGGAFQMYQEGEFAGLEIETFAAAKSFKKLGRLGECAFCGKDKDDDGKQLKLTDEHIISEFLGADTVLASATCDICQSITSSFEQTLAEQMFKTARNALVIRGKSGLLDLRSLSVDLGSNTKENFILPQSDHPTILMLPSLFPAPAYSSVPVGIDNPYSFLIYNINASKTVLDKYDIGSFSTHTVDQINFSQLLAKIAHVYATHVFPKGSFIPSLTKLIRKDLPVTMQDPPRDFYSHIGSLWQCNQFQRRTNHLHEVQAGTITWQGRAIKCVRIQLFSCFAMPSYFVAVE